MRRFLTVSGLLIILTVALSGAILYYAVFTQGGLRFIVGHMPRRFGTVEVRVKGASGTLAAGVRARQVVIDGLREHMEFRGVFARMLLPPLYWRTIDVPEISADTAYIEIKRRRLPPPPHPHFLPWWLRIRIGHAHIDRARVVLPDGRRLRGSDIDGAAHVSSREIRFYRLRLRMGNVRYAAAGILRAAHALGVSAHGRIIWMMPHQPRWLIEASLGGDLHRLEFSAKVLAPCRMSVHGLALDLMSRWHWRGEARVRDLDLRAWHRSGILGPIDARLALAGDARGFEAGGTADPTGLHAGIFRVGLDGRLESNHSKRVLIARRLTITHLASGAHLAASGSLRLGPGRPQLALRGSWRHLRWPLAGKAAFHSRSGTFTLAGDWPVNLTATGIARVGRLALTSSGIVATLGSQGLSVQRAQLGLLGGQVLAHGEVRWLPPKRWTLRARVERLDPGQVRPLLRGRLGFTLSASGEGFHTDSPFAVRLDRLHGRLHGLPASGAGGLSHSDRTWRFERVRVSLGAVRVALNGYLARRRTDVRFSAAGNLHMLAAGDRGVVQAAGTVDGPRNAPDIRAWARGAGVKIGGLELASLDTTVNFHPSARRRSVLALHLRGLRFHGRLVRNLDLTADGPASDLRAHLSAGAPGLSVHAAARGSLYGGVFAGQVTALHLTGAQALNLHLRKPALLTLSRSRSALENLCLSGAPAGLCVGGSWTPASWSAYLTASHLPLATLTAGMTPAVEYQGTIGARARLEGGGGASVRGSLRASLTHAVLSRRLVNGRIDRTPLGSGLLSIEALPGAVRAQASLTAGAVGSFNATLDARRVGTGWRNMPIRGTLRARTSRLDLVSIYLPGIDEVSGNLLADAAISGTLAAPRLTGLLSVSDGTANWYRTNLRLQGAALQARLNNGGVEFDGSARVGRGTVHAAGQMHWRGLLPYGHLHLTGNDLLVVDTPEAQVDASPDLRFDVAAHRIEVSGTVFVPYASIHPRNFSGAVHTSSDQVIVGGGSAVAMHRYQVMSTVTLGLGNDVNIDTMGLTGRLTGAFTVRSGYGTGTRATGELLIVQGHYAAYARKLDIEYGRLLFRGGLLDDPGIEIRAVKSYPQVTAGIDVSGTLQQPQVSFFSNPSLSQSQIMSLLFSGGGGSLQALQTGATAQSQQTTAAGELLAQGGALLAQQLGEKIGLPAVSLETDLNNVTSLVLGKYLSPRLYVSYGVGLTQQLNEIRLRYSLTRHLMIRILAGQGKGAGQSKSGQIGGADLVFSVVR